MTGTPKGNLKNQSQLAVVPVKWNSRYLGLRDKKIVIPLKRGTISPHNFLIYMPIYNFLIVIRQPKVFPFHVSPSFTTNFMTIFCNKLPSSCKRATSWQVSFYTSPFVIDKNVIWPYPNE